MTPNKPLIALLATTLIATVGYAVAQTTSSTTSTAATTTTPGTSTTTEVQTVVVPGATNGVVATMPVGTYKASNGNVEPQSVMSTGVNSGSTRISVGDHATPPMPKVQTESVITRTTTVTPPIAAPAPYVAPAEPVAAPAAAPAPMVAEPMAAPTPAPRADRN